jgi:hypothetical protein
MAIPVGLGLVSIASADANRLSECVSYPTLKGTRTANITAMLSIGEYTFSNALADNIFHASVALIFLVSRNASARKTPPEAVSKPATAVDIFALANSAS